MKRIAVFAAFVLAASLTQCQTLEVSPNGLYHTLENKPNLTSWESAQKSRDHFFIVGFWRAEPNIPDRANVWPGKVSLTCNRTDKVCTEWDAGLMTLGKPGLAELSIDSTDFDVVSWDATSIVGSNLDGVCQTHTLLVDFSAQTVMVTDSPRNQNQQSCKPFKDVNTFVLKSGSVWVNLGSMPGAKK
jgi:hypothetical protein